jgi:hypothetical protein
MRRAPFFAIVDDEVDVFMSREAVEGYVEPVTIEDFGLQIFDSEGRPLSWRITVVPTKFGRGEWQLGEPLGPPNRELLADWLRKFLREVGSTKTGLTDLEVAESQLDTLIQHASRFPTAD